MKKNRILALIIFFGFLSFLDMQGKELQHEYIKPFRNSFSLFSLSTELLNDNAFNKKRYIKIAKEKFNIDIDDIYFGHNKTGITAVIINTKEEWSEEQLIANQENVNAVFTEYKKAIINIIYQSKNKHYAIVLAKKTYSKEDAWIVSYRYESAMTTLREKVDEFKLEFANMNKFKDHEIYGFYYGLSSFPIDKSNFPSSITCITKDKNGEFHRFNFRGKRTGDLWSYRYDEKQNKFYSTESRLDPQIQVVLENEDMININLYYFEDGDERYGTYHFRIK